MRRATALLTGALAVLVTVEVATAGQVEGYGVALAGTVVLGTVLAAVRLWGATACTADLRMAIGLCAGLTLCGQVTASWLGGPGLAPVRWGPTAIGVVVVAVVVLGLVVSAALVPPQPERRHPYAL